MSSPTIIEVTCNACGTPAHFTAWESLNASLNPELRQRLLDGELTRFDCPQCGASATVLYPLLYHDMERQFMIRLVSDEDCSDCRYMPRDEFMADYQLRFVSTVNQLIDKILIFDAGLDDRLLELGKRYLRQLALNEGHALKGELRFDCQVRTAFNEDTIQMKHFDRAWVELISLPLTRLELIRLEFREKLPPLESEAGKWMCVDEDYAAGIHG